MNIESIFTTFKTTALIIEDEKYFKLSATEKVDYVSSLIRSFRENLINYLDYLEKIFRKNQVTVNELYEIETNFFVWCERMYQTMSHYLNHEYIDEIYFFGLGLDELFKNYDNPSNVMVEVPKDDLMKYIERTKEYLKIYPLKSKIFTQLKLLPSAVIFINNLDQDDESQDYEGESEGAAVIGGQEIHLPYPFYTVAKHLEKLKAFSEESSVSQNVIHQDLNLRFSTPRIKQWKKIKGKTNPVISKVFEINSRGYVWLKKSVKVF